MVSSKSKRVLLVIPCYNEAGIIETTVEILFANLTASLFTQTKVVIADNGSIDNTKEVVDNLKLKYSRLDYQYISVKGRGNALKSVWQNSNYDYFAYMDADLSTDLSCLPELFNKVINEEADLALGSRLLGSSIVQKSPMRTILSRGLSILTRVIFPFYGVKDSQCGFKIINRRVLESVLFKVRNSNWFFDTELLLRATRAGFSYAEIPVKWTESKRPSTVAIINTVTEMVLGLLRLRIEFIVKKNE